MLDLARRMFHLIDPRPMPTEEEPQPEWRDVVAGPLVGRQLLLPAHADTWDGMTKGSFEPLIHETAERIGGLASATVWDVGAHMGYHSLMFASAVGPSGRVIAFEPNPYNVERMRENLSRNADLADRITIVEEALSDQDAISTFVFSPRVDDGTSSGSHLAEAYAPEEATAYSSFEHITVQTATADTLVESGVVPPPSFVKVDVEGAEEIVLSGAMQLLVTIRPTLLIEVHQITTMFHVTRLLREADYRLELLSERLERTVQAFVLAEASVPSAPTGA